MEKTRTLPPKVRGRVTGVLDFFVDEINIKDAQFLDTLDLILQVQWWGEELPTYIRPKKTCYRQDKTHTVSDSVEMHFQSARYEIKTTVDLFESYLRTCEVLELCVLDAAENCIIGSAFIKDLVNFLSNSNNLITLPIFDYVGEEIGDITVSFSFLDMSQQKNVRKLGEIIYTNKNSYNGKFHMNTNKFNVRNKTKESYFIPIEKNVIYDKNEEINYGHSPADFGLSVGRYASQENKKIDYVNHNGHDNMITIVSGNKRKMNPSDENVPESLTHSCKCLPVITTSNDSSKILHFHLDPQKSRQNSHNDNPKIGVTNRFNSNSIKCKSKSKSAQESGNFLYDKKFSKKKPTSQAVSKICQKNETEVVDIKRSKIFSEDKSLHSEKPPNNNQTVTDYIPLKDSINSKVLDFLFGSDLSEDAEQSAIDEFKKMSPSHNLVASINQLCLTSDSNHHKPEYSSAPASQWTGLSFNFKDPIERNYYETFFLNSPPELELAEILNRPENSAALENLKSKKNDYNKSSSVSNSFKSDKFFGERNLEKGNGRETVPIHPANIDGGVKGCARCKYYKKLDELDAIIESLKHFEKKMLMHDKDVEFLSENSKMFTKRSQRDS